MCGRYGLHIEPSQIAKKYSIHSTLPEIVSHYNITPRSENPVICETHGKRELVTMTWGLLPPFVKDQTKAIRPINVRLETIAQKPIFRDSFQSRRCIVPATEYYEWKVVRGLKQPYRIFSKNNAILSLAGIFDTWIFENTRVVSYAIVTATPVKSLSHIHDRMPLVLSDNSQNVWLSEKSSTERVLAISSGNCSQELESYEISPLVNNPKNDIPQIIQKKQT